VVSYSDAGGVNFATVVLQCGSASLSAAIGAAKTATNMQGGNNSSSCFSPAALPGLSWRGRKKISSLSESSEDNRGVRIVFFGIFFPGGKGSELDQPRMGRLDLPHCLVVRVHRKTRL
jgi:hypothetical protein